MLDRLTRKLAEKMGQSVKETVIPIKEEVSKKVERKVDLYSRIVRLGVLVFLFIEGTKKVVQMDDRDSHSSPYQITINNYITGKEDEQ